jgi:hypothetical protein
LVVIYNFKTGFFVGCVDAGCGSIVIVRPTLRIRMAADVQRVMGL